MALYELRTYTLRVGAMAEAVKLYQELGFPALQKGGQDEKLVGYFQADTGTINQLVHLWRFDDDDDRRAHWAAVYGANATTARSTISLRSRTRSPSARSARSSQTSGRPRSSASSASGRKISTLTTSCCGRCR